jgi:uncharacterized 2Fe-2S/4Fe-4S cluster protein (DUF4445 family)
MAEHTVKFNEKPQTISVPTGTLIVEAAQIAGVDLLQPCGGQGRCGRCVVQVPEGAIRSRSTLRLTPEDIEKNYTLACQAVIEGDVHIIVPPQEKISRILTTDRVVAEITVPEGYDPSTAQVIKRTSLSIPPPSMEDQTDDWSRFQKALRQHLQLDEATSLQISLPQLRQLGGVLRSGDWQVTATYVIQPSPQQGLEVSLIDIMAGNVEPTTPVWGVAIDIGTTTVTVWLVDLQTGHVRAQVAEYNQQVTRGEDVISRIIYASKDNGILEMQALVLGTINTLIDTACKRVNASPGSIVKATVVGNSIMMHLFLAIPAESIRLTPFITAINHLPIMAAHEIGLAIHPDAIVDCLPCVASYVGADITAGVLSSGLDDTEDVTLFMDVGTNGEIVLGTKDWLVTCAASAGPAFEGAGVKDGMRATRGAIEEVWINGKTYEPSFRVIGGVKPRGLCGSGLISLLAELFLTGVVDKAGHVKLDLDTPRVREGEHGGEYVIAWANETVHSRDIVITHVDIDNLLRAKAAIYAGFSVLANNVGVPLETVTQVLIGGAFGQYINVEKAVEIGLLPDLPWERFHFLGNTAARGSYQALLDHKNRARIREIASRMTYVELSADNSFYEAFMSALFLPHTDISKFPTVGAALSKEG